MTYALFHKADELETPIVINCKEIIAVCEEIIAVQAATAHTVITMTHGIHLRVMEDMDTVLKSIGFMEPTQ